MWKWIIAFVIVSVTAGSIHRSNVDSTVKSIADLVVIVGLWIVIKKWRQHKLSKKGTLAFQPETTNSNISPQNKQPNDQS